MRKIITVITVLLTSLGISSITYAQEVDHFSKGSIGFVPGQTSTLPVDPDNPDPNRPVSPLNPDPDDPILPGTPGPLSIDFASSFDFGVNPISNQDKTYFAKAQSYNNSDYCTPNYVQVTDNRGTGAGWLLTVTEEGQFCQGNNNANNELKGASLSLKNATPDCQGDLADPTAQEAINIVPGQETIIAKASQGRGMGTWVIRWGNSDDLTSKKEAKSMWNPNVKLFVPGSTVKEAGSYSTTLNWKLSELPNN